MVCALLPARSASKGRSLETFVKRMSRFAIVSLSISAGDAVGNDALPEWYSASDYFVMASSREGWPNAVCEALACGIPVIGTKVWGMPEIVTDDALGILIDERTPEALAQGLERALGRNWDRAAIAARGGVRTWEDVSRQMAPLFDATVREAGKP